ncbi:hypothetical protein MSAN_01947700 [Mycena sanguinolenta]|uniref:DUF6534 domain-containing protein n=1 Tax=Mycena sanguinolenta TaxID=230812 RepID=A0A8H7CQE3_9AGAR|nr:hypothetical protein MSAN_01947700 [Mycena sanguinolenta]
MERPIFPATVLGPTFLGILFNWGLMGVLAAQFYYYHVTFKDDRPAIKILVYGLFLIDAVQTAMITADGFHWFVYGFGNALVDDAFLNPWDVPFLDSIIALVVQVFYCWRIYVLRGGIVIPVLILLISATQFAAGIIIAVRHQEDVLVLLSLVNQERTVETVWLIGGAVADVAIAGVLSWTLLHKQSRPLHPNNSIISRIVRNIVETNTVTGAHNLSLVCMARSVLTKFDFLPAGVAVTTVILFWAAPETACVATGLAILGKLYTNCFLALLNSRRRDSVSSTSHSTASAPAPHNNNLNNSRLGTRQNNSVSFDESPVKVHVTRETIQKPDRMSMIK